MTIHLTGLLCPVLAGRAGSSCCHSDTMVRSVRWMVHSTLPHTQLTFRVRMMAMVELLDFVEQGQAEGLLAMEVDERIKKHSNSDTEKVARIDNMNENSYLR